MVMERVQWQHFAPILRAEWQSYLLRFGIAFLLALFLIVWSVGQRWWFIAVPAFLLLLLLLHRFLGSLILAEKEQFAPDYLYLFELGEIDPYDKIVQIDLGRKSVGMALVSRFTMGKITIVDVYHPELTPNPHLKQIRNRQPVPRFDPRLEWLVSDITLLPFPDGSVPAVLMQDTLRHFAYYGDQERLLKEIYRILKPSGRLLLAEYNRTWSNWFIFGWAAAQLATNQQWNNLLQQTGFYIYHQQLRHNITICWRVDKPTGISEYQIPLPLS